jgi:DNA-directed RNA polymerase subunit RPC12/RpoP
MVTCHQCGKTVSSKELSKNYGRCQDCFQKECSENEYCKARQLSSPDLIAHSQEMVETCSNYIPESDFEKKGLGREMNKENESFQIVLDFSSLRDVMTKNGITIMNFVCPSCHSTVKIPEAGNILICQYCREPIRPNEIFKKIFLV